MAAGWRDIVHLDGIERVVDRGAALDPDVRVIALESLTRHLAQLMFLGLRRRGGVRSHRNG